MDVIDATPADVTAQIEEAAAAFLAVQREEAQPAKPEAEDILDAMRVLCPANDHEWKPKDEVIEGLLFAGEIALLFGASNTGKTFVALEQGACVCDGRKFFGRRVERGAVLYCAAESPDSVRMRCQALIKYRGYRLADMFIIRVPLDLYNSSQSATDIIMAMRQIEKQQKVKFRMVFIDTLARVSGGADENSTANMTQVMLRVDHVRNETGCAVVVIHHAGKDQTKGERGTSAIRAHIDNSLCLKATGDIITLDATKARDRRKGETDIAFRLMQVDMGANNMGRVTSAVCEQVEADTPEQRATRLTDGQRRGLESLKHALEKQKSNSVHLEDWRNAYYEISTADNQGAKQKAFSRARGELASLQLISVNNDLYSLTEAGHGHYPDMSRTCLAPDRTDTDIPLGMSGVRVECLGNESLSCE